MDMQDRDPSLRGWQSDVIVDLIKQYGFAHLPLNPGASFRGLHDSLINYGKNQPPMLLCQHEEIAVQIAHGYAKATNKPGAVILHNLVGLLHATMAIYYAYIDRVPIFIIGATGPMDEGKRRPHIDWTHSALVQGNAIRDYVKWDYQPTSIEGVPESFARAYSIMTTEPQGPVYMCYDAGLQEAPLEKEVELPPLDSVRTPAPMMPDPGALREIADRLLKAEHPVLMAEYVGRRPDGFESMIELAETVSAPVWDVPSALNFPNKHPLSASMDKEVFRNADLVVCLDVGDWERSTTELNSTTRTRESLVPASAEWVEIGFGELNLSKWSFDYGRWGPRAVRAIGDTQVAIPELTRLCRERLDKEPKLAARLKERAAALAKRHDAVWEKWQREARDEHWDSSPLSLPRLAHEVWEVIKDEDWVLTANPLKTSVRRFWDFDKPYRHPGRELGTSTQIGISLGVALAHKGTGRLVVDFQPDGDLMFDAGALWNAAKHEIPLLIVMFNNRAYYNDWEHQIRMARLRGTDEAKAHIGMDLFGPEPDFGALARSMGCYGEGPIERPEDVGPALRRAIAEVKKGRPALVDTITMHR
jgi:acetolactate synthase-1/2/3 large subunit